MTLTSRLTSCLLLVTAMAVQTPLVFASSDSDIIKNLDGATYEYLKPNTHRWTITIHGTTAVWVHWVQAATGSVTHFEKTYPITGHNFRVDVGSELCELLEGVPTCYDEYEITATKIVQRRYDGTGSVIRDVTTFKRK